MAKSDTEIKSAPEDEMLRLSRADQIRVAQALTDPPEANERLIRAAERHGELTRSR